MQENLSEKPLIYNIMRVERTLAHGIDWISTLILIVLLTVMVWQVVARFILKLSVPWTDELARYLWISITYVGAGAAISENNHVEISIIPFVLKRIDNIHTKKLISKILDIVRYVVLIALAIYLLILSWPYMLKVKSIGQFSASMHLPSWLLIAVLVFGLLSILLHSIFRIIIAIGDHQLMIDPLISGEAEEK